MIEISESDKAYLIGFLIGMGLTLLVYLIISSAFIAPNQICPPCLMKTTTGYL